MDSATTSKAAERSIGIAPA